MPPRTYLAMRYERIIRNIETERDQWKAQAENLGNNLWNAQQDLAVAQSRADNRVVDFSELTDALANAVPQLWFAPTAYMLKAARTAQEYARVLETLLRHAQNIGEAEGRKGA